jgi:hypothetical protein
MTRRERKDMKWIVAAFAIVLVVGAAGLFVGWR